MISQSDRGIFVFSVGLQLVLSQVLFWAYFAVFNLFWSEVSPYFDTYFVYSLVALAGLTVEATSRRNQDWAWTEKSFFHRHNAALRQTLFAASAIVLFLIATKDRAMSRVFLFSYLPMLYAVLLLTTWTPPEFAFQFLLHRARRPSTLLIGPMARVRALVHWLRGKQHIGFDIAGVLSDETTARPGDPPLLGTLENFRTIVSEKKISLVILTEPPADTDLLSKIISDCEHCGIRLLVVSDLQERFHHKITYTESGGLHFIGLREEPLENLFNRLLKRGLDVVVALPAVIIVLPLTSAFVWLLQRWQSPGPLFYTQDRAGFQNNTFRIIKFRTMHVSNADAARQATRGDERIFPAGKWLRKFSVDELPQFTNVLRGQMSVVGPRPHLREHNERFSHVLQSYHIRTLIKPGITGLAQVRGFRGEATDDASLLRRIQADIYYLENWSLTADLIIILRTACQLFFPPKSAY